MRDRRFKKGDIVQVTQHAWGAGAFERRGQVGKIVTRPERVCYDYHKASYGDVCDVEFADGKRVELDTGEFDPARSAVDRLADLVETG